MKKKLIGCIALLLAALTVLAGCSSAPAAAVETAEPTPAAVVETTPEPTAEPTPVKPEATDDPLPDVDITSWEFIIANTYTYIGRYNPTCSVLYGQIIDSRILDQIKELFADAEAAGYKLYNSASFRNFDYYENHYNSLCAELGSALAAVKVCTPGGCSDHNTALAIDFTDDQFYSGDYEHTPDPDFQDTEAYQWLLDNAQNYGFVQRYIDGKEEYYGLPCCPGHFRYVGVEAAKYMKEHNLCLEEFVALYQ